jgi:DNA-nicking Smr family endonuclease
MAERKLTHEDRIVWEKVARTVKAYAAKAVPAVAQEDMQALLSSTAPEPAAATPAGIARAAAAAKPAKPGPPELHPIEKPVLKKLARGRLDIEARLDLHGLKRAEAHNLLHDFLVRARERGMRHVLVITGKGSSLASEGVLRREVPIWLAKPEFRPFVSGHEFAAQGHGGDGALYVRLRRQKGHGE